MFIFIDQRKKIYHNNMENQWENMLDLLRQARINMAEGPNFIPLEFVNLVRLRGDLESYTALEGYDLTTPEGQDMLLWNSAMYITCVDVCLRGVGHLPYQLLPHWGDPVVVDIDRDGPGNIAAEDIVDEESDDSDEEDEGDEEDADYPDSDNGDDAVVVIGQFHPDFEQVVEGELWLLGEYRALLPGEDPAEGLLAAGEDVEPGDAVEEIPLLAVQPNNHLAAGNI
jgi:hypothetical protein